MWFKIIQHYPIGVSVAAAAAAAAAAAVQLKELFE